jgi:nitrate/nitrite-specific signal transduction histidine kinase
MNDGLPSNTLNNISAFCDNDGTMYFGTRNGGLFYFHPDDLKDNDYKPPVYITEFRLKNKPVSVTDSNGVLKTSIEYTKEIKLNYRQNLISFTFSALNYVHPEKNKYKYMLEGYDEDWVYTDASKRFVNYTNLDHGSYTFKVKASNNDGVWNETPTELKILITPPFWKTTWFRILLAIAAAGFLYAIYRYRLQQVLKLHSIRNRIAADLHDDIGSTLNSISVFSEVAKNDPSRRTHSLQMIGESSRKVIDAMSDIVWTINPDNDNFEKIILRMRSIAYNLLRAKKIEFSFRADETLNDLKLSLLVRRNFYFIFKEALNNLIKYSEAKRVSILLEKKSNGILLMVRDDGVGFDPGNKYNGNGLTNMRRRSKEINANLTIDSGDGIGTSVQLTLKS